jgi:hypothetical protein
MTTLTTPLSNEICEEILRLKAGERSRRETPTLFCENGSVERSELKRMLSFMIEELKVEFRTLRRENIKLHEELKEMKTELQNLRLHLQPNTPTVVDTEKKERHSEVVEKKDTTFYIVNHLSNNDFSLPLFNENTVNPMFHLTQLDNYINLSNLSDEQKLTLAYKSMNSEMSTQWVETIIKSEIMNHLKESF